WRVSEEQYSGRIMGRRCWRQVGPPLFGPGLEGREIHERLENRAGVPAGHRRAGVLRLVVAPSANHRKDFAGLWIDGDERRLCAAFSLSAGQHLVHMREAVAHRIERE